MIYKIHYLAIGAILPILLLILPSGQVTAQVSTGTFGSDAKYYSNDKALFYIEFPVDWTATETDQGKSILLTGNGAQLEITNYDPTPGSYFPSANTSMGQVIDTIKKYINSPNIHLDYQSPQTISGVSGYQLSYSEDQQEVGHILTDDYILISAGRLYEIIFTAPESIYQQNQPVRDSMIHSIQLGDSYTTNQPVMDQNLKSQVDESKEEDLQHTLQAIREIERLNGVTQQYSEATNSAMGGVIGGLKDYNQGTAEGYNKGIDGYNDDYNDDVINEEGVVTDYNK